MSIDYKIFIGLLVTGIIFIILGLACVVYGILHKDGNERQKSHGPFGVFLIMLGVILTFADVLSPNAFLAAAASTVLSVVLFAVGINKIRGEG